MANVSSSKNASTELKDIEISVPIAYGNVSFWRGTKASDNESHRWTVFVRGANNEDLSVVIKRVVFQLHSSFDNSTRVVKTPPFQISESGWGEFEIVITLHFHDDVSDKPLNLRHFLKLYTEQETGPISTKKPVVVETYDEIVVADPSLDLLARAQNHPAINMPILPAGFALPRPSTVKHESKKRRSVAKGNPLNRWFRKFSESEELSQLTAARTRVQTRIAKIRRKYGKRKQPKSDSDQ